MSRTRCVAQATGFIKLSEGPNIELYCILKVFQPAQVYKEVKVGGAGSRTGTLKG